ncbi:universal stress protein [Actinomycetota bacterium]
MTIVVAYADTPPGHSALRRAAEEAILRKEPIVAASAVRGSTPDPAQLATVLGDLAGELEQAGLGVSVQTSELHDPADGVIQVAQEVGASLICVGLRQRTPIGKLVLGSTAQRILLDATTPVMTVKPD